LIHFLLEHLQSHTLQTLRFEADQPDPIGTAWTATFNLIAAKASNTLEDLTIEHHIDIDDSDLDIHNTTASSATVQITNSQTLERQSSYFTLDILRPLRGCPLRRLTLDSTYPADFCNEDMESMTKWWPDLKYFDVGCPPSLDCIPPGWSPRTTLDCLSAFSNLSQLENLILPLSMLGIEAAASRLIHPNKSASILRRLTVVSPSPPDCPMILAVYFNCLFPNLIDIDGMSDHDDAWNSVRQVLHNTRSVDI